MQCELCYESKESGGYRQIAGITICPECNSDNFSASRVARGGMHLGFWSRSKSGTMASELKDMAAENEFTISALAEIPDPTKIFAKLQYEGFGAKVHKVFEHEIQIGDKAFDDLVWIRTNTKEDTRAFLSIPGVQQAISELIEMKSVIDIEGAKVYVKAENDGKLIPKEFVLHTVALAHYLSKV